MFIESYFDVQIIIMYFYMFGMMLILPIPCLSVLLRLAVRTSHLKIILVPGISSLRQVVPLITSIYPIMFFIITYSCIGLILMGPNRSPQFGYVVTLFTPESFGQFCYCFYMVLALILHYVRVPIILLFYLLFMSRSLFLIGTWSLT